MTKKIPPSTERLIEELYEDGEQIKDIANICSVSRSCVRGITSIAERGYDSYGDYQMSLLKRRGFKTKGQYDESRARKRQKRPENQRLSRLITAELKRLGKNQSWLANQITVSRESVSKYCQGKYIPKKEVLKRLSSALNLPYDSFNSLFKHAA